MTTATMPLDVARADLCRFLSACYYEPTADLGEARVFESIRSVATIISPELAAAATRLEEAFGQHELTEILVDHTRLFVGPGRPLAIPYGAFWLEGGANMSEESTQAVQSLYQQGGFDVADDFGDLPDHIAVELEFLYVLLFNLASHQRDGSDPERDHLEALRRQFIQEHLGRWIRPFAVAVRERAETAFYRELAGMTESMLRLEIERQSCQ